MLSVSGVVLALMAAVAPVAIDRAGSALRGGADAPSPVVASAEETRAILGSVLAQKPAGGRVPAPPKAGQPPQAEPARILILTDRSQCFAPQGEAEAKTSCLSAMADSLLAAELDASMPRKLREELLLANREPHPLLLAGIRGTQVESEANIERAFAGGWWDDFYRKYPGASGIVRIGRPVLTKDRQQALIYVAHSCGGLCGKGMVYLLSRSGAGWSIVQEQMLWIS
ncbi:hypothetical protein [Lysobacter silvisoli]|uniref:Uncharacterized protein n=1 Tax=Lysobacter silvisoli TaxID=2293254 RepID=A0A371K0S9_9GAMM|nr:hypothetical protein [Lysobacter silvisoli]RDZ27541.1 hypothetical protein DX914_15075 [Lysobacter silvisoli]